MRFINNYAAILGGLIMQAQVMPMVYDSWANGHTIPLATYIMVVVGLGLITLRYRADWFIISLNLTNIFLHTLVQLPRLF
jgi:hypothetical protein